MSLDVQIKIDGATKAVSDSKKVEDALGRVEDKGPKVGESVERGMERASRAAQTLGRNFASLDGVMTRLARAHETHASLNNTLAQSFAGVAAQIEREKSMLTQIHGPTQQYEQDVRTLNKLFADGKVTGDQYAATIARIGASARSQGVSMRMSGGGEGDADPAKKSPGALSNLRGLAVAAGITVGANEIKDMSVSYDNLSNRLRQVATSQGNFNELMSRTREIANNTRSDWATTAEAFVRLSQATKSMGVSQERGLKITETLNMALQSSGASASEATAGTLQLMQAMAAGALQGDEFRSISENIPIVMDLLAKQLGVTRGELKKLGAEGKITSAQMVAALEGGSERIRKQFEKSDMTLAQWATTLKNDVGAAVGSTLRPLGDLEKLGHQLADAQDLEAKKIVDLLKANNMYRETLDGVTKSARANLLIAQQQIDKNGALIQIFKAQYEMMMAIKGIHFDDPWGDNRSTWTRFKERIGDKIHGAITEIDKRTKAWTESLKDAAKEAEKLNAAFAKYMNAPSRTALLDERPDRGLVAREEAHQSFAQDVGLEDSPSDLDKDLKAYEQREALKEKADNERAKRLAKLHESEMDRLREEQKGFDIARQRMADGFADVFEDVARLASDGKASINDMIRTFTMGALKMLSQQAIGSAFSVPGFATGGSFTVGGHGGTDTTPIAFMATPGERVSVDTPAQQAKKDSGGGGGSSAPMNLAIHFDERDVVRQMETSRGQAVVVRVVRRALPQLRRELSGR